MHAATADCYSSIKFRVSTPPWIFVLPAKQATAPPTREEPHVAERVSGPTIIPAAWLPKIEKHLMGSIGNESDAEKGNDGSWLSYSIATTAVLFFQATSDLLPSEPYIYSSMKGDLVAEFGAPGGTMTSIVGDSFVMAFAVARGAMTPKRLTFTDNNFGEIRRELEQLTTTLRVGDHGAVETEKR